jgi:hypothetical protein
MTNFNTKSNGNMNTKNNGTDTTTQRMNIDGLQDGVFFNNHGFYCAVFNGMIHGGIYRTKSGALRKLAKVSG